MSIQEKFESATTLITEHNSIIGTGNPGWVEPEQFIKNLKSAGGTSEERLRGFSYEEILACMPKLDIKPVALAKDVAKIFRGKEENKDNKPVSIKKADRMTLRELIEHYDPEESDNSVGKRLKEISKNEPFIIYSSGRIIDVDNTLKLLQEVKQGFEGRKYLDVNGEVKEVYCVGSIPDNFIEENPLYRGRPLRPDGTCDQTGRSWDGISVKIRQLIRVAIDINEIKDISIEKAHSIFDIVMEDNAWKKLSTRYPKAVLEFNRLESLGNLPKLRLVLTKGGSDRPFDKAKKVEWQKPPYTR